MSATASTMRRRCSRLGHGARREPRRPQLRRRDDAPVPRNSLTNGCPEEVAAAKAAGVAPSPFFLGGKGSWVHSLTAIAAPHNGTTFIEANSDFTKLAANLATGAAKALGLSSLKGVYDFQLDQFGIRKDDNETFAQALDRVLRSDFLSHNDNAFLDLTIDNRSRSTRASRSSRTSTISPTRATRPRPIRSPATTTPPCRPSRRTACVR